MWVDLRKMYLSLAMGAGEADGAVAQEAVDLVEALAAVHARVRIALVVLDIAACTAKSLVIT